jgi:hypothetical protein
VKKTLVATCAALGLLATTALAEDAKPPFGTPDDIAYAQALWDLMVEARLAGPGMIRALPYEGSEPHGMMLETFYTTATIDGHTGDLVVKRNFGPEGVEADTVLRDPDGHLGAYTIMFRREAGYDPENLDWFWARYNPDGSVAKNPKGMSLAGQVAKGSDQGCIACHQGAEGDLVFTSDHLIK